MLFQLAGLLLIGINTRLTYVREIVHVSWQSLMLCTTIFIIFLPCHTSCLVPLENTKEVHKEKNPPSPQKKQSKVISSTEGVLMNLKNQKVKIEDIKKGLFRNLKVNVSKIDDIAMEKLPFWHEVFCKDFSKKIDDNFAKQNIMSKAEIMNLHNKFKWCSDDRNCKSLGAKYLGFFSSRSLKTREKCISFAQFVYFLRKVCLLSHF